MNYVKKIAFLTAVLLAMTAVVLFLVKESNAQESITRPIIRRVDILPEDCKGGGGSSGECFYEEVCTDVCASTESECPAWRRK